MGYECLSLLLPSRGDNVVALFTHEDNPNEKIWFKTPAVAAREHKVPIYTPEKIGTPRWIAKIQELKPDLILSVYYRNMISTKILALAPLGAFNMHGSLLPKYRGRAPINWAVLHGEPRIGMTLHRMVKAPDAGAIVDQEGVGIGPRDTAEQAFRKVIAVRPKKSWNARSTSCSKASPRKLRRTIHKPPTLEVESLKMDESTGRRLRLRSLISFAPSPILIPELLPRSQEIE